MPSPLEVRISPVEGIKLVERGDKLGEIIAHAIWRNKIELMDNDIVVVTQKIVSKSEGSLVNIASLQPTKADDAPATEVNTQANVS